MPSGKLYNLAAWDSATPNNNASVGDINWAEGQAPSTVNNSARQTLADVKQWQENLEWVDYGYSISFVSTTVFKFHGTDRRTLAPVNRRVRAGVGAGEIYGTISQSSLSASDTQITVTWDSGVLDASLSYVALGVLSPSNNSLPRNMDASFSDVTVAGVLSAPDGSAAAPSIKVGDEQNGLFSPAANQLGIGAGGESRIVVGSAINTQFSDYADNTKIVELALGSIATGTTRVITVQDSNITLPIMTQALTFSGPTAARTYTLPDADTTFFGAATQAEQETATSVIKAVTPGRQQFHPSAIKGWDRTNFTGTAVDAYNLTSETDNGAGNVTANWATDFAGNSYGTHATVMADPTDVAATTWVGQVQAAVAAGTTNAFAIRLSDCTRQDANGLTILAFGDQ